MKSAFILPIELVAQQRTQLHTQTRAIDGHHGSITKPGALRYVIDEERGLVMSFYNMLTKQRGIR